MPASIFLLGPNEWDDDHAPEAPYWIHQQLHNLAERDYRPIHLRFYLKDLIERDRQRRAVVMDPADQHEAENDGDFFRRLELENRVDSYFIIIPSHAKVLGTVFEGGMLERDFHFGRNPSVILFLHNSYASKDLYDKTRFIEKGKRTQYLETLAERAHHVGFWEEPEELIDLATEWAKLD